MGRLERLFGDEPADEVRADGGVTDETTAGELGGDAASASWFARVRRNQFVQSLPFWGPPGLLVLVFVYGAVSWNFLISLTGWEGLGQPTYGELSLAAYRRMLGDSSFFFAFRDRKSVV